MSPVTPRSPGVTQSMPVLTDRFVAQHKPAAARQEIGDSLLPGHFFIIQPSGHRSFALRYRFDGKSRKLTIGTDPVVGLKAARDKARDALGKVQSGVDPGRPADRGRRCGGFHRALSAAPCRCPASRHPPIHRARTAGSGESLARPRPRRHLAPRCSRVPRHLHRPWFWREEHGFGELSAVISAGQPIAARSRRVPAAGLKRPAPETKRDRVLSDAELTVLWRKAVEVGGGAGALVRLLILTGCRRDEIARLTWNEITADAIELPATRTKTNVAHRIRSHARDARRAR